MNQFRVTFSDDEAEFHNQPQHAFITEDDDDEELFLGEKKNKRGYFGDDLEEEVQADPLFQAKKNELHQKKKFNRLFCVFMITVFLLIGLALVLSFSLYIHFKTYFNVVDNNTSYCSINFNQTHPTDVEQFKESRRLIQKSFGIEEKQAIYLPYSEFPLEISHLTGFSIPEYYKDDVLLFLTNSNSFICIIGSGHDTKHFDQVTVDNIFDENICKTYLTQSEFVIVGKETSYNPLNLTISANLAILDKISESRLVKSSFDRDTLVYASDLISNSFTKVRNFLSQSENLQQSYKNTIVEQFYQSLENCISLPLRNSWISKIVEEPITHLYGSGDSQTFSIEVAYSYFNNRLSLARTFVVGNNYTLDERLVSTIEDNLNLIKSNLIVGSHPNHIKELISNNTMKSLIEKKVITPTLSDENLLDTIYKEALSQYFISRNFFDWLDSPNKVEKFELNMAVGVDLSINIPDRTDPVWKIIDVDTKLSSIKFKDTFIVTSDKALQIGKN